MLKRILDFVGLPIFEMEAKLTKHPKRQRYDNIKICSYLKIVFFHLIQMPAVQIQHANTAADRYVILISVKCSQVNHNGTKSFLDFCGNGIEKVVQRAKLLEDK